MSYGSGKPLISTTKILILLLVSQFFASKALNLLLKYKKELDKCFEGMEV